MYVIATNSTFTLLSSHKRVVLLDSQLTQVHIFQYKIGSLQKRCKCGALQYDTGIVAMCSHSHIMVYDFIYKKQLYSLQTYQQIIHVSIIKNLLISGSNQRILLHDMNQKNNVCYLAVQAGPSFTTNDYYQLWIAYPAPCLTLRSVWLNKIITLNSVKYDFGCFSNQISKNGSDCPLLCLSFQNNIFIYHQNNLKVVYQVQRKLGSIISFQNNFYSFMDNGIILKINQNFLEVLINPTVQTTQIQSLLGLNYTQKKQQQNQAPRGIFSGKGINGKCIYAIYQKQIMRYDLNNVKKYFQFEQELRLQKNKINQ